MPAHIHGDHAVARLLQQRPQQAVLRTQIAHARNGQHHRAAAAGVVVRNQPIGQRQVVRISICGQICVQALWEGWRLGRQASCAWA